MAPPGPRHGWRVSCPPKVARHDPRTIGRGGFRSLPAEARRTAHLRVRAAAAVDIDRDADRHDIGAPSRRCLGRRHGTAHRPDILGGAADGDVIVGLRATCDLSGSTGPRGYVTDPPRRAGIPGRDGVIAARGAHTPSGGTEIAGRDAIVASGTAQGSEGRGTQASCGALVAHRRSLRPACHTGLPDRHAVRAAHQSAGTDCQAPASAHLTDRPHRYAIEGGRISAHAVRHRVITSSSGGVASRSTPIPGETIWTARDAVLVSVTRRAARATRDWVAPGTTIPAVAAQAGVVHTAAHTATAIARRPLSPFVSITPLCHGSCARSCSAAGSQSGCLPAVARASIDMPDGHPEIHRQAVCVRISG